MWPFRKRAQIQEFEAKIREYEIRILDALTYSQTITAGDSNAYTSKSEAVKEIVAKYICEADYGCQLIRRIIGQKVAETLPYGVSLIDADDLPEDANADPEREFLQALLDYNDLSEGAAQDLERQAQFEGQVLVRLVWEPETQQVRVRYLPWLSLQYEIVAAKDDLGIDDCRQIDRVEWHDSDRGRKVTIPGDYIAFVAFGNEAGSFDGHPALAGVLREVEELDKALRDWATISKLFAKQTPYFKCEDESQAETILAQIQASKWKVGTAFASSADFQMHGPSGITVELLREQVVTLAKIISGATGVSIHHLGFADVMSNRSTAESMADPVESESASQQSRWVGFYEDLFEKAIALRNRRLNKQLQPGLIKPSVTGRSRRHMDEVEKVWLPARQAGEVSRRTFLEQLPDVDVDSELEELDAEQKKNASPEAERYRNIVTESPTTLQFPASDTSNKKEPNGTSDPSEPSSGASANG